MTAHRFNHELFQSRFSRRGPVSDAVQSAVEALESRTLFATITVTMPGDDLTPNNGSVSLREAITAVNAGNDLGDPNITAQSPGTFGTNDAINFNIPGAGVKAINITSALPTITKPVTINGYTQGAASVNTLANADNAVPLIELFGSAAGAGVDGLTLGAGSGGSTVRGLVVDSFPGDGIVVQSNGNTIAGNFVGIDPTGTTRMPNGTFPNSGDGIRIENASNNAIGTPAPADRNVVSGNAIDGIHVLGTLLAPATGNVIQNNFVGVAADGKSSVGNRTEPAPATGAAEGNNLFGIEISGGNNNTIGGTVAGARNVVGLNGSGINVDNGGQGNVIQGNYSGVGSDGVTPAGNLLQGVVLRSSNGFGAPLGPPQANEPGVSNNVIGGTAAGAGNLVAFNGTAGIAVFGNPISASGQPNVGNSILGNSVFLNGRNSAGASSAPTPLLGIDLSNGFQFPRDDGVTPNDSQGHGAPNDPNNFQNFPVLTSLTPGAGTVGVNGTLSAAPSTTYRVEFFGNNSDPLGLPTEGQTFLGFLNVTTDGTGNANFSSGQFPASSPLFTATATDPVGNTSEFSAPLADLAGLVVTNTNDNGPGSLRNAIGIANAIAGLQTITFNIPGAGVHTIKPASALPALSEKAVIDGYTQPGSSPNTLAVGDNAVLLIEIDGSAAGAGAIGLQISGGNSTVRGLVINRFTRSGIDLAPIAGNTANVIEGNYLGTDATGTIDRGNGEDGVMVRAQNNTIGGTTPAARNIISGNTDHGVEVTLSAVGNSVLGNYIGTDATGALDVGNTRDGVFLFIGNNTIGGTVAGSRNIISGNDQFGVHLFNANATGNDIQGNFIGTNAAGTAAVGNTKGGVSLEFAPDNTVGGTTAAARNVISGNGGFGVQASSSSGNAILGNYIGTNANGSAALANPIGVQVFHAMDTLVGGPGPAGNLISGNAGNGVDLVSAQGTTVVGNRIGTDAGGALALGNNGAGVFIRNEIGSPDDSQANLVGGTTGAAGNTIAFNAGPGVVVTRPNTAEPSNLNAIRGNAIFGNAGLSIDLADDGITFNDNLDPDAGPNDKQNFPVLLSAATAGGMTTVTGFLNSLPSTGFFIDFYASDTLNLTGQGESKTFLGTALVTTNASGVATINQTFPVSVAAGQYISATATSTNFFPAGNTSEFSPPAQIPIPPPPPTFSINDLIQSEGNGPGATAFTFNITRGGDLTVPASVQYSTADGTATAPSDYVAVPLTTVNFAANQTTAMVTVNVVGDAVVEPNETFFVNLSNASSGATTTDAQAMGTITNDDIAPPPSPVTVVLGPDPSAPGKTALLITGTDNGEMIEVDPGGSSTSKFIVQVNGVQVGGQFSTSNFGRIVIDAKGGDDQIDITSKYTHDTLILAGQGNDTVKGGYGADIIVGGDGNDVLSGRKGRDLIIGGAGGDGITGDEDDDLLIAAATTYDADLPALYGFMKEWTSSNSYSKRRDNVRNGTGSYVGGRKFNDASIIEDTTFDQLSGNSGTDLFFYHKSNTNGNVADKLVDKSSSETAVDVS